MRDMGYEAVVASEPARPFETKCEQCELTEALGQATAAVSGTLDLEQILDHILEQVDRVIHGDAANIMLVEGELGYLVRSRGYERAGQDVLGLTVHLADAPILSHLQERGEPVIIGDTPLDILAAQASDIPVIAVATGVYSVDDLRGHRPDAVIAEFSDSMQINKAIAGISAR